MENKVINVCYRKVITIDNESYWDKLVFNDTFTEFKMQAQYFNRNKEFYTFSQLLQHVPNAEKLHFLVSAAVGPYINQLQGTIPDITNNLGRLFLKFNSYRFEIINSDIRNINKHCVAINFFSEDLIYISQIGQHLLTARKNATTDENGNLATDMFTIVPYLSIFNIKSL